MSASVLPIGQSAGAYLPDGQQQPAHHAVRIGRTTQRLTATEFAVWLRVHESDVAAELEVGHLMDRGVLAEITDPAAFAQGHRLVPLFLGLGNHRDDTELFDIGVPGLEPLATVDAAAFELWRWGWVAPSLWAHCEVQATLTEQQAEEPTTPDAQLATVLDALRPLLANFVAFLEPIDD